MAGRAAPIAIDPSGARGCLAGRRGGRRQQNAPAVTDRLAPSRSEERLAALRHPLPVPEVDAGESSSLSSRFDEAIALARSWERSQSAIEPVSVRSANSCRETVW